jgi:type II secretory pathway component GspD/PulD (secretin)
MGPRSAAANKEARWTLSIRLSTRTVPEVVELVQALEAGRGGSVLSASRQTLTVAGPPSEIERLVHIVREIDAPDGAGLEIWTVHDVWLPAHKAYQLEELLDYERDQDELGGAKVSKIIPDDLGQQLIIVADRPGFACIEEMLHRDRPDPPTDHDPIDDGPIELPVNPDAR